MPHEMHKTPQTRELEGFLVLYKDELIKIEEQ